MDEDYEGEQHTGCLSAIFKSFVCVTLTLLLGIHLYAYFGGNVFKETFDGDFSDIKYVVMQLTRGLTEVNRKHERLQSEMERISSSLPAVADRARDVLEPARRRAARHPTDLVDYDRQMIDFALESAGGRVLDTGSTVEHVLYESALGWWLHAAAAWACGACSGARALLRPGALPGECWAFKGSRGEVTVRLLGSVYVTAVSLEHIPPHIAPTKEISSAPRLFKLEGLEFRADPHPHDFGTFEYDKEGKPIQYFEVLNPANRGYSLVRIKFFSNWGHPVFTCVYRVRIHGNLAPGQGTRPSIETGDDLEIENE